MNLSLILLLSLLAVGVVGLGFWLSAVKKRTTEQVIKRLQGSEILLMHDSANCFGIESGGMGQVRGNGCLACTADDLYFQMWLPRKEIHIQRSRITDIDTPKSHLGKSKGFKLLKVHFTTDAAMPDSVAWQVRDLDKWVSVLRRAGKS